jgi:hypothetical protein
MNNQQDIQECFGLRLLAGEAVSPPTPNNDNWRMMPDWRTPAEALQKIRRWKEQIGRDLAADDRLWACPEHRLTRKITLAMERCALWHFYGVR